MDYYDIKYLIISHFIATWNLELSALSKVGEVTNQYSKLNNNNQYLKFLHVG